jgi:hypothetical protein
MQKLGIVIICCTIAHGANAGNYQELPKKYKTYRNEDLWVESEKAKAIAVNGNVYQSISDQYNKEQSEELTKQYEKEHYKPATPSNYFPTAEEVTKSWEEASRTYQPGDRAIIGEYSKFLGWASRDCPND